MPGLDLRRFVMGCLGTAVAATAAPAADLSSVAIRDDATIVLLQGDIEPGDADAVEALIKMINDDGRLVSAIRLNSPGGSLAEAIRLAELTRRAKVPTVVAAGSRCASACFIVFASGVEKFASYDAAIGVHGVSDRFGHQTMQTEAATRSMARIASELGVPPRIVGQMIATRPSEIAWLSPDDLRAMGTIMTGRPGQTALSGSAEDPLVAADLTRASAERPSPLMGGPQSLSSGGRHPPAER
jgi:hypothetical protein